MVKRLKDNRRQDRKQNKKYLEADIDWEREARAELESPRPRKTPRSSKPRMSNVQLVPPEKVERDDGQDKGWTETINKRKNRKKDRETDVVGIVEKKDSEPTPANEKQKKTQGKAARPVRFPPKTAAVSITG
ncbi:unnamed protein product [Lasius platythorax]|uniref:Uncharacterized protein n=1 Tax=Lasius platythorax TaxID=488582 RepID=A0AAV2MZG9_9HYME